MCWVALHDVEFCLCVTAQFVGNLGQCAEYTLLDLWQTQSFIVRLQLILVVVDLAFASTWMYILSTGPALWKQAYWKEKAVGGAREPAVMNFIFPYSVIFKNLELKGN